MSEEIKGPVETIDFEVLDKLDEQQIAEEIAGTHIPDQLYYTFKQGGRDVTGLSYMGVKEAARSMVDKYGYGFDVRSMDVKESGDGKSYTALCQVKRTPPPGSEKEKGELTMWGAAEQGKDSFGKPDTFAFAKVVSKAQRNAIRNLIPELLLDNLLKECVAQGKGSVVDADSVKKIASKGKPVDVTTEEIVKSTPLAKPARTVDERIEAGELALIARGFKHLETEEGILRQRDIQGLENSEDLTACSDTAKKAYLTFLQRSYKSADTYGKGDEPK